MGRKRTNKRQTGAPAPKSGDAGRKVLEIYELLYCICTYMDMGTLFNAQRVSKRWHEIISRSPLLQQNLYLEPCPPSDPTDEQIFNPLLLKHFEPLLKRNKNYRSWENKLEYSSMAVPGMSITHMKGGRKVHKAFIRRSASWRRMLVSQPPITAIGYAVEIDGMEQTSRIISFPDGLRMGALYDMVFQAIFIKPTEAERHCNLELHVPPDEDSAPLMRKMTEKLGERPGLLFTSASGFYASMACSNPLCPCSSYERAMTYCREMRESIRERKGMRWMFECEEFEETDYLSLGQASFGE
ncbi:putative f-box domain protein [Fusarium flagelliforme]|uniref:Putative f-box domain protein n=1 Tax=Fusarium flagelliforme TaxID=2675880 RepID=A0A395MMI0_9HYPO|nr:putative f-box domain protein [Fusarium flagelliforme]